MQRRTDGESNIARLVATMLLNYPEMGQVSYEQRGCESIHWAYVLDTRPSAAQLEELGSVIEESIATHHLLAGIPDGNLEIYLEGQGNMVFLHVIRDIRTLTQSELTMINELVGERFDEHILGSPIDYSYDTDAALAAREDMIENGLRAARGAGCVKKLIGIRGDDGNVKVYGASR